MTEHSPLLVLGLQSTDTFMAGTVQKDLCLVCPVLIVQSHNYVGVAIRADVPNTDTAWHVLDLCRLHHINTTLSRVKLHLHDSVRAGNALSIKIVRHFVWRQEDVFKVVDGPIGS